MENEVIRIPTTGVIRLPWCPVQGTKDLQVMSSNLMLLTLDLKATFLGEGDLLSIFFSRIVYKVG
jgi:hypothetical protein